MIVIRPLLLCFIITSALATRAQAQFELATNNGAIIIEFYIGSDPLVVIPNNINGYPVTGIADSAFSYCMSLTSVTIGSNVATIGNDAFSCCNNLTNVTLPNSVTDIGHFAFSLCTRLPSITLPDSVRLIGNRAFYGCSTLTNVTMGSGVTNIGDVPFDVCRSLIDITVDSANPAYCSVAGVLFEAGLNKLIQYPGGRVGNYTIPNGVTRIGDYAFNLCSGLTGVTIPSGVVSIGDVAFSGCTNSPNITIPSSVTNIGHMAFSLCSNLQGVFFAGNPPRVGQNVFDGATNAAVYYLPGTLGWTNVFAGRPAVLWNPSIPVSDPGFGPQTSGFGFVIVGATNIPVVVEGCTDLALGAWTVLQRSTLTNGSVHFNDIMWTNHPSRFYRIRSP